MADVTVRKVDKIVNALERKYRRGDDTAELTKLQYWAMDQEMEKTLMKFEGQTFAGQGYVSEVEEDVCVHVPGRKYSFDYLGYFIVSLTGVPYDVRIKLMKETDVEFEGKIKELGVRTVTLEQCVLR